MGLPGFLLRRLYKRGSLRETGDGRFAFTLLNLVGEATILAPPRIVVNGIAYAPEHVASRTLDLAAISERQPYLFRKGTRVTLRFPGRLLRGGNRIHITADTREFGELEIYVEDREAEFCDVPGCEEE